MTAAGPGAPEDVFDHIADGDDLIVPLANGEPVSVIDAIEAHATRWRGVRIHQMHALHDRPYLHGATRGHLDHVSYFLSSVTRPAFHERGCELVPNHFSEVPRILRESTRCSLVLAAAAPMDAHGYFSLGTNCDYVAPFIGRVPFFLEVNERMPRTFGANQVHVNDVVGWTAVDRPLVEVPPAAPSPSRRADRRPHRPAHPGRRHDPSRHRCHPERPARGSARGTGTWACTPSCSRTRWSTSSSAAW